MRDETIQFLFDRSPLTIEDQIDILTRNYSKTIELYRVLEAQIIQDFERRLKAYEKLDKLRTELSDEKLNFEFRSKEDDEEKEKKVVERHRRKCRNLENQINMQKAICEEQRPLYYQQKKINTDDILALIVFKHFWRIRHIARLDSWIRRMLGVGAAKTGKKYRDFVSWCAVNTGTNKLDSFEEFCNDIPEKMKKYFQEKINLDEHRPVD